jgi:2-C-methyl-D-erythritol 2,4-cyclodiphosphate synthase
MAVAPGICAPSPRVIMYRTGIGYDLHRVVSGRPLLLGGVRIPAGFGLGGHSDADVVLHALCDALLGAAGLGDIGELFPDDDPACQNADSRRFVAEVLARVRSAGHAVCNADVVIHAERPKLAEHKAAIKASLAKLLDLPADAVGVKATTNEGLDAVGRGEAVACWATVLLAPHA